jgi:hypothetical protein
MRGDTVTAVDLGTCSALAALAVRAGALPLYGEDHRRGDLHW